jgi:hypothetical protein
MAIPAGFSIFILIIKHKHTALREIYKKCPVYAKTFLKMALDAMRASEQRLKGALEFPGTCLKSSGDLLGNTGSSVKTLC